MDIPTLGKWIFFAGLGVAAVGLVLWVATRTGIPLGRLPGDIHIHRDGFSFYLPLTTMIIVSILLTIFINVVIRIFLK